MNTKVTIGIVVLIVVLPALVFFFGGSGNQNGGSMVSAPDFSLEAYDGSIVTPRDFPGKVLVVNSWATWCPFCVDELPAFAALAEEFKDEIVVIAIDRSESLERAKSYTDNLRLSEALIFLLDPADSFYTSIGGFSMPETLFVTQDGAVAIHKRGPMDITEMREKVRETLEYGAN